MPRPLRAGRDQASSPSTLRPMSPAERARSPWYASEVSVALAVPDEDGQLGAEG